MLGWGSALITSWADMRVMNGLKARLIKAIGEVESAFLRHGRRGNIDLKNKVLVGTHHKTGTDWMLRIFRRISRDLGLRFVAGKQREFPTDFDVFIQHHSRFDLTRLDVEYRGLHLIRDPRDVIISGCFFHQKSGERWLHIRRGEFGGLTYQEKINSYATLDDKIMFEMENHGTIRDMLAWSYSDPRFVEVEYEDLIVDDNLMLFHRIFAHLGFPGETIPGLLRIASDNSLFSGNVRKSDHVRSGEKMQWKDTLSPVIRPDS